MNSQKVKIEAVQDLTPSEIDLIYLIRHVYRFGEVTILTRDGSPQDIIKTVARTRLGNISTEEIDILQKQFTIEGR